MDVKNKKKEMILIEENRKEKILGKCLWRICKDLLKGL
jgi:hypothetical protein